MEGLCTAFTEQNHKNVMLGYLKGLFEPVPMQEWPCVSIGEGAKRQRLYEWAAAPFWRLQIEEESHFGH
jgi:hypothetical protein